jgi:hypothetical protein
VLISLLIQKKNCVNLFGSMFLSLGADIFAISGWGFGFSLSEFVDVLEETITCYTFIFSILFGIFLFFILFYDLVCMRHGLAN